jgi:hypothetical protein
MRGEITTLLAATLVLSLGKPGFADVIVSSTDPNIDSSINSVNFVNFYGRNLTHGVQFTVN